MTAKHESIVELLAALHEERLRTWEPWLLKVNINQRRHLVEAASRAAFVKPGDRAEPFTLTEVGGQILTLEDLIAHGPVALLFFRYADCPACNIALPYYERTLAPELARHGVRLVAVSPQVPEPLAGIKRRHGLSFEVATDADNALGRRFGLLYEFDEPSKAVSLKNGRFIGEVTGTGTWELPQPAIVIIDQHGIVRFADVSPDWMVRTESGPVLDAVRGLTIDRAA